MWSKLVRIVIYLVIAAAVVTEGMPSNDKRTDQNQVQAVVPKAIQADANDVKGNSAGKHPNERHYPKMYKKIHTSMVDDDLLEFLVRVADNPTEWNKIQRVLNMLGREEMDTPEESDTAVTTSPVTVAAATAQTPLPPPQPTQQNTSVPPPQPQQPNTSVLPPPSQQKTTSVSLAPGQPTAFVPPPPWMQRQTTVPEPPRQPDTMVPPPPQKITVPAIQLQQLATTQQTATLSSSLLSSLSSSSSSSSWPSGDWILEAVEKIRAAAKARRKGSGSDAENTVDYDEDDGGDDEDDYSNDEIEEIEEPPVTPTDASIVPATAHPSPPQSPRLAAGHMSRYQFKRIDGRPDDGRVNGTYVAVVESDRPSRDVTYDPVMQIKPNAVK